MTITTVTSPFGRSFVGPHRQHFVSAHDPNARFLTLWQADQNGPEGEGPGGFRSSGGAALDAHHGTPTTKTIRDEAGDSYTQYLRDWVYITAGGVPDLRAYLPADAGALRIAVKLIITGDARQEETSIWFAARRPGSTTGQYPTDFLKWKGASPTEEEDQPDVYPGAQSRRLAQWHEVRDWATVWVALAPHPTTGYPTFEYAWGARVSTRNLNTLMTDESHYGIAIGLGFQVFSR